MPSRSRSAAAFALGATLLLLTAPAAAQGTLPGSASAACLDAIPDSALARVPVYVEAAAAGPGAAPALPAMDAFLARVGSRLRAHLGGGDDRLPPGEPAVTWRTTPGALTAFLHRDGRVTWHRPPVDPAAGPDAPRGVELVGWAVDDVVAAGERVPWPDGAERDSLRFELRLPRVAVAPDGARRTPPIRLGTPVYTLAVPPETPAAIVREPRIAFPLAPDRAGAEGTVIMRYVVDTLGRVDPASIEEQWPADRPRLRGDLGRYYDRFVVTVRRGLPTAEFTPARIAGCPVRRLVRQPFVFGHRR